MKSIIHSTENNNFYLYDTQRILSMLIHPELKKIHEKSTDINIDAYKSGEEFFLHNPNCQSIDSSAFFLDIQMGSMTGIDVAKKLRSSGYKGSISDCL